MRIVILNTYSWFQKGDAAIVLGTVKGLRRADPGADITMVSMTPDVDRAKFEAEHLKVIGGPFGCIYETHRPAFWRAAAFASNCAALLAGIGLLRLGVNPDQPWLPRRAREMAVALSQADFAVSVGGGFWTDSAKRAVYMHLFQVMCALITGLPVVCLGQSIGPFRKSFRSRLVGRILGRSAAIVLREQESLSVVRDLGIDLRKVHLGADMAFALAEPLEEAVLNRRPRSPMRIGVTARKWLFPRSTDARQAQESYERILIAAIDELVERYDADVVFLPQVIGPAGDDDRIVQSRIAGQLKHSARATVLREDLSPAELVRYIGGELDLVIATRFHSAIFTMLANVPVVAIAYEHKTTGIMKAMGLSEWVIPIEQVDVPSLMQCCAAVCADYGAIKARLNDAVRDMSERAIAGAELCVSVVRELRRHD